MFFSFFFIRCLVPCVSFGYFSFLVLGFLIFVVLFVVVFCDFCSFVVLRLMLFVVFLLRKNQGGTIKRIAGFSLCVSWLECAGLFGSGCF